MPPSLFLVSEEIESGDQTLVNQGQRSLVRDTASLKLAASSTSRPYSDL